MIVSDAVREVATASDALGDQVMVAAQSLSVGRRILD